MRSLWFRPPDALFVGGIGSLLWGSKAVHRGSRKFQFLQPLVGF